MGLDTTHDAWHGAYSAFCRWRDAIAKAAGYDMIVYPGDPYPRELPALDWGHLPLGWPAGEWPCMPTNHVGEPEPLIVLIAHSDCDGVIKAEFCGPLADRLEGLIEKLPEGDSWGDPRRRTGQFIAGLRKAAAAGEDVEFA